MGEENLLLDMLGDGPFAAFILALCAVLGAFSRGLWDWIRGRHDRERADAKDRRDTIAALKDDLREAERKASDAHDDMLQHRRRAATLWEYASRLRQHAICKYNADPDSLPEWPDGH